MEDSKCVAMGKRENILPFQIIQMTNEKMTLPSQPRNFFRVEKTDVKKFRRKNLHFFGV